MATPKQFRVTFKAQGAGEPILGYAVEYKPHLATYVKKKESQDNWAYGLAYGHYNEEKERGYFFDEDGQVWIKRKVWDHDFRPPVGTWVESLVPSELQPKIIDNPPQVGFRIQNMVSRYYSNNKLWRILDPRGFELEISSGNLEDLLFSCVIDKGLIIDECIWTGQKTLTKV